MLNDKLLNITVGNSRKSVNWLPQEIMWSELCEKLRTPYRSTETLAEYMTFPKSKQDDLKDVGGFVGGTLNGSRRTAQAVTGRDIVTLDLDSIPAGETDNALRRIDGLGCGYCVYSTRKHCEAAPRLRVLIPLNRTCTNDEYEPLARKLAEFIGMELCDPSTFEASRLMYWPSCSADSNYIFTYADKPFIDADGITHFEEKDQFAGRAEIRTILQSTMRGGELFWNFESYNPPISASNWANEDSLENRPDRLCHKSTYLDVPREWLGEQFFTEAEILREQNPRAYEHEYLGVPTGTGGNVFENVVVRDISNEEIAQFDRLYNGVDWGWYPDPFAFDRMHFDAARRTLYIFDEYRCNKKGNAETAKILTEEHGITPQDLITADSAEPKSVGDYRSYGLFCRAAEKGAGSVEYSMKWLQSLCGIVIDGKRCPETAKEFLRYEYERSKEGDIVSGYPDRDNHHIDAVRYGMSPVWRKRGR